MSSWRSPEMVLFIAASLPLGNIQILVGNILKLLSLGINWEGGSCFPGCSVRLPGLLQCWLLPSVPGVSEVVRKSTISLLLFLTITVEYWVFLWSMAWTISASGYPGLLLMGLHLSLGALVIHVALKTWNIFFSDTFSCCCSLLSPSLSPPRSGPITWKTGFYSCDQFLIHKDWSFSAVSCCIGFEISVLAFRSLRGGMCSV